MRAAHCEGITGRDPARLAQAAAERADPWAPASATSVDHDVVRIEQRDQLVERELYDSGGQHEPDGAWLPELCGQVRERGRAGSALSREFPDRLFADVLDHAVVAVAQQQPHEVGAHSPEPDHSQDHRRSSSHRSS